MAVMSPAEMATLRNEILTSLRPQMTPAAGVMPPEIAASLRPFMTGMPGSSPLTDAAINAFKVKTLPIIQQQMTLKGLGHSPAVSQVTGEALSMALPEFINADMTNRLNATNQAANLYRSTADTSQNAATLAGTVLDRDANLGLSGSRLAADIANQEGMRAIEGARTAGQLQLGLGDLGIRTGQLQQDQQRLALQAGQGAGGLQRDITQAIADAAQAERLRLQGLSEGSSFGVFGGGAIPPSVQQASKTTGSSSK